MPDCAARSCIRDRGASGPATPIGQSNASGPLLHHAVFSRGASRLPVFIQDRVNHLIVVLAISQERAAQQPLLDRANLSQRAVAAAVLNRRARLEPMNADGVECEIQ